MKVETLQQFCWAGDVDNHLKMQKPWSVGEFTFATNGHLLIKVPRLADVAEIVNPIDIANGWPKSEPSAWLDIPTCEAPAPVVCQKCNGKKAGQGACPECGGDGEVEFSNIYNTYTVDCATCDGEGEELECSTCDGTGTVEVIEGVAVGCSGFSKKYLALLATLPNCQIGPVDQCGPAWFRFDGGEGAICPVRPGVY
ncbi:MAG: hypothetical protein A2075_09135 [Geobacteraceae bacterium GWC2_58_44]|nr:MAG: hypothetical protein A2075_09135 [Geobacteraceae bacterium GWC2_58_44]HBG07677.1 hypothetical protein [Geobacter sp.]